MCTQDDPTGPRNPTAVRVLFVTERFWPQPGGVAVSALRHARGLAPLVHRLDVVHATADLPPGTVQEAPLENGSAFRVGRSARDDESLQLLELVLRGLHHRFRYDVMHGFYAVPAGMVATAAARLLGLPSVVSLRGNDVDRDMYRGGRCGLLDWTLRHATRLLCVSRELQRKVAVLADRDDAVYTPNAVDGEAFQPEALERGDVPCLLFSGEMRFKKGLWPLLQAVERLTEVRLVLAGGVRRDDRDDYERWRRRAPQAAARVETIPYERDPARLRGLYNRADLVVLPALWEGMPNAVLEAMACARPVLASACGGVPDVLREGETGYLLAPWDLERLAERIAGILALPVAERIAVGERARAHVLAEHRPDQEIARVLQAYRA